MDPAIENRQVRRLKAMKERRDKGKAQKTLEALRQASQQGANTTDAVIDCLESYCTLGEICGVWRETYGEFRGMTGF